VVPAADASAVLSSPVARPAATVPAKRAASAPDSPAAAEPPTPVIGSRIAAARARVRLSVDDLADRTRIRPHVIEAIEADDFSVCGGDVYARGHLRVLARILGIDPTPLITEYDARYADDPVTARKVFEAELAGPGRSIRTTTGGPRWSVLAGVVLVLVLLWTGARMLVPSTDAELDPPPRDGVSDTSSVPGQVSGATPEEIADRFAGMGEREPASQRVGTRSPG
jgi:cytoskeletal protein RodZ